MQRNNANAITYNNSIWIIGGKHQNESVIEKYSVEIFNPKCVGIENCQYWSLGPEILTPIYDSCSVVYRDELYVIGGRHKLDVSK